MTVLAGRHAGMEVQYVDESGTACSVFQRGHG
jgi:hypothetical protein